MNSEGDIDKGARSVYQEIRVKIMEIFERAEAESNHTRQEQLAAPAVRHCALEWWLTLSSASKTRLCDIHTELVGSVRRWETLTGREVQMIYESEHCA